MQSKSQMAAELREAPDIVRQQAKELSTRLFDQYVLMYFRKPSEMQGLSDDERRRIEVTMGMFLTWVGSRCLQVCDRS